MRSNVILIRAIAVFRREGWSGLREHYRRVLESLDVGEKLFLGKRVMEVGSGPAGNMNTEIQEVELQLASWCNRSCDFCPSGKFEVPKTFMSRDVFETVVRRLQEIRFQGKIGFHLMSEPLLDKRLPDLLDVLRRAVPNAFLYLDTNGDPLKEEKAVLLFQNGLNRMLINCYDSSEQVRERLEFCRSLCKTRRDIWFWNRHLCNPVKPPHQWKVIRVRDFTTAETLELKNWAGHTPLWRKGKVEFPLKESCGRPFQKLHINYKGEAVLCNMDWKNEVVLGSLVSDSIPKVWNESPLLTRYREKLANSDRDMPLCRTCDNGLPYDNPPSPPADRWAAYRRIVYSFAARAYSRVQPGVLQGGK